MKTESIRQRVTFHVPPQKVFEAFMDSRIHAKFTGRPAKIDRKVGGAYSAHGGYITGNTLEIQKDKKIVQTWKAKDFPDGHESRITLTLKRVPSGTQLSFFHSGVPLPAVKGIKDGWNTFYWEPMKKLFGEKK